MKELAVPLRHKPFRRLWAAQIAMILAYWLGNIALAIVVFDETGSSWAMAALFLATRFLPALVGPAVVAKVEAMPTRKSLLLIFAGEALLFLLLALLTDYFSLALIAVLAFAEGTLAIVLRTFLRSTPAAVLKPLGQLRQGNTLLNISFTWGWFVGPAIAGPAVAAVGGGGALLLGAAIFLIGGLALAGVQGLPEPERAVEVWHRRLREGMSYVRRHVTLRPLFVAIGLTVICTDIVWPIEVILVKDTLGGGDSGYGFFLAAWGVGMAVGGIFFAVTRFVRLQILVLISAILLGVAFVATAFAPNLLLASAAQLIGGFGNGFQVVAVVTVMQEITKDAFVNRMQSLFESVIASMQGFGFILGGALAAIYSARFGFFVAGAGTLLVAAGAAILMRGLPWTAADMEEQSHDIAPSTIGQPIATERQV